MNNDMTENRMPETAAETARRELAEARENHATAYFAAQDVPSDPEEALLRADALRTATRAGKGAYRGYVQAATASLAAQIGGAGAGDNREEGPLR